MFALSALVFSFSLFIYCGAAYVDTLPQCSIKDTECIKGIYLHMMQTVGSTGIEELGIPSLDPMLIKNISLTILKTVTVNVTEGEVKGMIKCVFNEVGIDWEKESAFLNSSCEALYVKGHFKISGENPEFESIIGSNNLNGEGRVEIKLTNVNVKIEFTMYVAQEDGEIYIKISRKNIKYNYDIGQAHFMTENVMIANNDLSEIISSYLNNNWMHTMKQFGSVVITALDLFVSILSSICDKVPANKYIIEDIRSYVRH